MNDMLIFFMQNQRNEMENGLTLIFCQSKGLFFFRCSRCCCCYFRRCRCRFFVLYQFISWFWLWLVCSTGRQAGDRFEHVQKAKALNSIRDSQQNYTQTNKQTLSIKMGLYFSADTVFISRFFVLCCLSKKKTLSASCCTNTHSLY